MPLGLKRKCRIGQIRAEGRECDPRTSSGLTETWPSIEPNHNRFGDPFRENNFGLIEIDWEQKDPALTLQLIDVTGTVRVKKEVKLNELQQK